MTAEPYPEVVALQQALIDRDLHLSVAPEDDQLRSRSYRRVSIRSAQYGPSLLVPVDDEYGDARDANPALMLHLVLSTCETYEETDEVQTWAIEAGLDWSVPWVGALYGELRAVVPRVREILGPELKAVSSFDFALDAGAAQALRKLG